MIQQILQLVRENSKELIDDNPEIPNEQNESAHILIADCLLSGIKQMAFNPAAISELSGGGTALLQQIMTTASSRISGELTVSPLTANAIVYELLPKIVASFGTKLADPNNSEITMNTLLQHLTGSEVSVDLSSVLEKFMLPRATQITEPGPSNMLNMLMAALEGSENSKS